MLALQWRAVRARLRSILIARRRGGRLDVMVHERYRQAVEALPPRQRDIFRLHRVRDLSIAEIAAGLEMPPREVEREFAEALLAIARAVEPSS